MDKQKLLKLENYSQSWYFAISIVLNFGIFFIVYFLKYQGSKVVAYLNLLKCKIADQLFVAEQFFFQIMCENMYVISGSNHALFLLSASEFLTCV